jgi:calcineurin-like phosphoesterase family protein
MALFFTADTHFGDPRTINIHRQPFANVSEMDEALVQAWNAVVGEEDFDRSDISR